MENLAKKVGKTFFFYIQTFMLCLELTVETKKTSLICQPRVMHGESRSGAEMLMAYMKWMTCNFWTLTAAFLSSIGIKLVIMVF